MPDKGKKDKKSVKGKSGKTQGWRQQQKAKSASKDKTVRRDKSTMKRDGAKPKTDTVIACEGPSVPLNESG